MPTLKEVADKAGVTVTTVSRMLNKPEKVNPTTIRRIRQVMLELDYQPNEIARSLSKKTSNFIGLIVPSARNAFFAKVIESMEYYTAACGYKMLLCVSNHERKKEIEYFGMLRANKVAGVIIASHTQDIAESVTLDAPIISIDRVISPSISAVCSDNFNGGKLAAALLARKGCRRIAYFSGGVTLKGMSATQRQQGFEQELRAHGKRAHHPERIWRIVLSPWSIRISSPPFCPRIPISMAPSARTTSSPPELIRFAMRKWYRSVPGRPEA